MNGAISDIVVQALGPFILSYEWWIFPRSVRSPAFPIQSSTLETKNWWRVWSPSFVFECWAFLLESSWAAQVLCVSSWTLKLEYSAYTLACLKISMENLLNEVLEFDVCLLLSCWSVIVPEVGHFDSACFFVRILLSSSGSLRIILDVETGV